MNARAYACAMVSSVVLTWVLASGAAAVNVRIGGAPFDDTIFIQASGGETNALTITQDAAGITAVENGQIGGAPITVTTEPPCGMSSPNTVTCPATGVSKLMVRLGDGDDGFTVAATIASVVLGGAGNDTLEGGGAEDTLRGEDGVDAVRGGAGNDLLFGDDTSEIHPGSGNDELAGGPGNDVLNGGRGGDTLAGDAGTDRLRGGSDADALSGGDDGDVLSGEGGDDTMAGGPGDDTVGIAGTIAVGGALSAAEPGNDVLAGGPGDDTLDPGLGGDGDRDTLVGDEGDDTVSYGLRTATVTTAKDGVAGDGQSGEGDNVGVDVERITGGSGNDHLTGGSAADVIVGGPGDDTIEGLGGDDQLAGDGTPSAGNDRISGGLGADAIEGEAGSDTLSGDAGADVVEGGTGGDTLSGGSESDRLTGGAGDDAVAYASELRVTVSLDAGLGSTAEPGDSDRITEIEDVKGGRRGDTVTGSGSANVLSGAGGHDYLDGRQGVDQLDGGASADVVAARDGARDLPVSCGPGRDFAIVDRKDPVVRSGRHECEQVDDGSRTTPRAGRLYVHPLPCTASGGAAALKLPAMNRPVPLRYAILLKTGYRGRSAPGLESADCTLGMRAALGRGRSVSADLTGDAVTVNQTGRRTLTTTLSVERPTCSTGARSRGTHAVSSRVRLRTHGRGRGRWKVQGRYSIGGTHGTDWTTVEGCSSTTTVVRRGRVRVFDRVRQRTVTVRAGRSYVARARGKAP